MQGLSEMVVGDPKAWKFASRFEICGSTGPHANLEELHDSLVLHLSKFIRECPSNVVCHTDLRVGLPAPDEAFLGLFNSPQNGCWLSRNFQ